MKIVLAISSRKLRNGRPMNPKNYPWGSKLIELLKKDGHHIIQVRTPEDEELPADEVKTNLGMKQLAEVILESDTFIVTDNFIQHYATFLGKTGIVIFSASDPLIYGYPQNKNLLKDRSHLIPNQFCTWEEVEFQEDRFVSPECVVSSLS